MKTAVITGANGFLGHNLADELLKRGVTVYAVIREGSDCGGLPESPNLHIVYCGLEELGSLPCKIDKKGFDVFYHFAWAGTSGNIRGDYSIQLKNAEYACDAVTAARRLGCLKFVYAGSIMEFECISAAGDCGRRPGLGNIYGSAKFTARVMAEAVASREGIDFIPAVISNIYGEGERSERFIVSALRKLINNERISCSTGEQLYDFIHIKDAAEAFYLIGEHGKNLNSYYIGSEDPKPLKDFIKAMRDLVAPSVEIGFGEVPDNSSSLSYKEFDTKKIYNELGFVQKVPFLEGIARTARWLRNNKVPPVSPILNKPSDFAFIKTNLIDSVLITPFFRADNRGYFLKSFEKNIYMENGLNFDVNESFYSYSKKGVIRGLHFQRKKPQAKIVGVISGSIFDVIVDLRPYSETFGKWESFILSSENHNCLYVPKGFAHGFQVISERALVSYKCMEPFIGEYDGGIKWNDEDLGITWPLSSSDSVIISEKDNNLPFFKELDWGEVFP